MSDQYSPLSFALCLLFLFLIIKKNFFCTDSFLLSELKMLLGALQEFATKSWERMSVFSSPLLSLSLGIYSSGEKRVALIFSE